MHYCFSFLKSTLPLLGIAILLAAGLPAPLRADGCEDISKMGESWHGVADFIENHSDNGKLRKADVAKVQVTSRKLMPSTVALAKVLVEDFSSKKKDEARVKSLGKQLQANLEELKALGDDSDWDDVGEIVDKIGDVLTKLADICTDGN